MPVQGEKGLRSFLLNSALFPVQHWSLTDCLAMISPPPPPMEVFFFWLAWVILEVFFLSYGTAAVCNFSMLQRNQKSEKILV